MLQMSSIRSVAILGAGTMGAQIAAHFANAGAHVLLLDITAELARDGLKRTRGLKPDPFFSPDAAALITTGGLDTDLAASPRSTGFSKPSSNSSTSSARSSRKWNRSGERAQS
jgi:xanthine/CO dehydrogenase XdhC/CoxF family maturation factor